MLRRIFPAVYKHGSPDVDYCVEPMHEKPAVQFGKPVSEAVRMFGNPEKIDHFEIAQVGKTGPVIIIQGGHHKLHIRISGNQDSEKQIISQIVHIISVQQNLFSPFEHGSNAPVRFRMKLNITLLERLFNFISKKNASSVDKTNMQEYYYQIVSVVNY